jgi:hypothetical protein
MCCEPEDPAGFGGRGERGGMHFPYHGSRPQGLAQVGLWAAPLGALAGIVAAAAAVWVLMPRPSKVPLPAELKVTDGW